MRRSRLSLCVAAVLAVVAAGRADAETRVQRVWLGAERLADRTSAAAEAAQANDRRFRALTLRGASRATRLASDVFGRTGFEVGIGLRAYVELPSVPGAPHFLNEMWTRGINFGWTQQVYLDSVEGRRLGRALPKHNFGLVFQTPLLMSSTTKRGGIGFGMHPPGAAAFVNGMYYEMELGSPGVFTLGVGHDKERGPYALHHVGLKLPFIPRWGPLGVQMNFRFHVFNPRLEKLVAWNRPFAERIQGVSERMNAVARRVLGHVRWPKRWQKPD
jgi:hypothetical protein